MGLAASRQEAFWEACGFGDKIKVQKFITEGIDVNWVSYTQNSCAIHVASQGKKEIVQMLLDAHCNVNVKDDRGNLALHHAAMKGHSDIIQMLIEAGSDIDCQDKNGWTALINAAYFCQPAAVEQLIKNKCSVHLQNKDCRTALHEACRSQSTEEEDLNRIARMLIEAGCDLNSKSSDAGEADFTPLMFCAYHGHPLIAQALIEAGCDIHSKGSNNWTALHWAADRSQTDVVRVLLKAGLDPLVPGRRGELAVDRAQNNEIRDLLESAVRDATVIQDEYYRSNPSAEPHSNKLKNLNTSINVTAEDHRVLVEQSENLKSSSTSAQSSVLELSLTGDVARVNLDGGSSSCSCSVHEEDGDSKDRNCYDPESVSKKESQLETVCGPSVDQGGSVGHDSTADMDPSVNIGPTVNHDPSVNIDTTVDCDPSVNHDPAVNIDTSVKNNSSVNSDPSVDIDTLVKHDPSVEVVSSGDSNLLESANVNLSVNVNPTVDEESSVNKDPYVSEGPPVDNEVFGSSSRNESDSEIMSKLNPNFSQ